MDKHIFFCVPLKKEIHKNLEWLGVKYMITEFSFLGVPFNIDLCDFELEF